MLKFNEHTLETAVMELFQDEGYIDTNGKQISRSLSEVLLTDDLKKYLHDRYANEKITDSEINSIILKLHSISETIYEANKVVYQLLCDGFILNREDRTQKDIYINLIDFDIPENNNIQDCEPI